MGDRDREVAAEYASSCREEALQLVRELGRIPAPSHHEERRAAFVFDWLTSQGARDVRIDEAKNVLCLLSAGRDEKVCPKEKLAVFAAHTDVVFDDTDELPLSERDGRLFAPGIGDDTACLVALLMATRWVLCERPRLKRDLLVVANSCEEGLGNLEGTKAVFERYAPRVGEFVSFDRYFPEVIVDAVGSVRYRITARCEGGHSWSNYGRPNAIYELCSLVDDLYALELPDASPTTRNVGVIKGGTTVNAIPSEASLLFEFRSTSKACLTRCDEMLHEVMARHQREGVELNLEVMGMRPATGEVDAEAHAALIARCDEAVRMATGREPTHIAFSTDANVPLSLGIPAVTVGAVFGGGAHTRGEWIDEASIEQGVMAALLLMLHHVAD